MRHRQDAVPTRSLARARLVVRRADASLQRPMAAAWASAIARIRADGQAMCERLRGTHQWSRNKSSGGSTNSRRRSPDSSARWNERSPGSTDGAYAPRPRPASPRCLGRQRCWTVTGTTFRSRSASVNGDSAKGDAGHAFPRGVPGGEPVRRAAFTRDVPDGTTIVNRPIPSACVTSDVVAHCCQDARLEPVTVHPRHVRGPSLRYR